MAACVLHNICLLNDDVLPETLWAQVDEIDEIPLPEEVPPGIVPLTAKGKRDNLKEIVIQY